MSINSLYSAILGGAPHLPNNVPKKMQESNEISKDIDKITYKKMIRENEIRDGGGIVVESSIPKCRQEVLKWYGWGFKDTDLVTANNQLQGPLFKFTGNRYDISNQNMPFLMEYIKKRYGVTMNNRQEPINYPDAENIPTSNITESDLKEIESLDIAYSLDGMERLVRSHGQSLGEIIDLRNSNFPRLPDIVLWPISHEDVESIVRLAVKNNLAVIPYGGGTNVTDALKCPDKETRTIISLDTSQMNNILWISETNMTACAEAGIIGRDLEKYLNARGYTTGHEPDSCEVSTLGGWVSTRASGIRKNRYGNIEDMLVDTKVVTAEGVFNQNNQAPRISCGPNFNHIILGSEGTLGVITEAIIKIHPLPEYVQPSCIIFPDFESGFKTLREVALHKIQAASMRLVDNEQFQFTYSMRVEKPYYQQLFSDFKMFYLTKIKRYDLNQISLLAIQCEGSYDEVRQQEAKITQIAKKYGGVPVIGSEGKQGNNIIFAIAYIRDFGLDNNILANSFETSVPWSRALTLISNVKHRIDQECKKLNIVTYNKSFRISQIYDAGCVVYFYFGFLADGIENAVEKCEHVDNCAREEFIASGGSISHHHGIGKMKARWVPKFFSKLGVDLYDAAKHKLDPQNIFLAGNIIPPNVD